MMIEKVESQRELRQEKDTEIAALNAEIAGLKEENENIKNRLSTLENAMRSGSLIGKEL